MKHRFTLLLSLVLVLLCAQAASAQTDARLVPGDPPRASLITVSESDSRGFVTITGASNAVFPTAQVMVRNLLTGETLFTQSTITGGFTARMFGPGTTPFLISPLQGAPPQALLEQSGTIPGGPATIIYGGVPEETADGVSFTISGPLAGGNERWSAQGLVNQLAFEPGERANLDLRLNVMMPAPQGAASDLSSLRFITRLELHPVVVEQDGTLHPVSGPYANNGWSSVVTPSGLAINDVGTSFMVAETVTEEGDITTIPDGLAFRLQFQQQLPDELPEGLYAPILRGFVRLGDQLPEAWETSSLFGPVDPLGRVPFTRLPLLINVGAISDIPLPFALFMDTPSDGARGLLPEDSAEFALSNRVRFNPETYILPPFGVDGAPQAYSLEPYVPAQLPNEYDRFAPPLIPLPPEAGRLLLRVTAPDGSVFAPGALDLVQSRIGTAAVDEAVVFGQHSPVNTFQLTTFDPQASQYIFSQYGEYLISVEGELEDFFGNQYVGGGEYRVIIAEPLELQPSILPGTPFVTGDSVDLGLRIMPAVAAEVIIRVRQYPLNGEVIDTVYEGTASRTGQFLLPDAPLVFDAPGEYLMDYEARYTDADGRLWAASLRSAGVIEAPETPLVAHGQRGLFDPPLENAQAWYLANRVLENEGVRADTVIPHYPYYSGDAVWIADDPDGGIAPIITLQDLIGDYQAWLVTGAANDITPLGARIRDGSLADSLPVAMLNRGADPHNPAQPEALVNQGYAYISTVHPGLQVRQFVTGSAVGRLPTWTTLSDPLNGQIGAGATGLQYGDVLFLFGGAVIRNADVRLQATTGYAAVAMIGEADVVEQVAPPARGADGSADAGPLLTLDNESYDAFMLPGALQPGSIMTVGDPFVLSGQVAPTLPVAVQARVTSPDGTARQFLTRANRFGYVYDPAVTFALDQAGVWTVEIQVIVDAMTSAGQPEAPFPQGGLLGAPEGRYQFYVRPENADRLVWNTRPDLIIPSALPYNFNFTLPQDLASAEVYYTLATPGYLLEQGTLRLSGRSFSYQHNPTAINRRFPNIEVEGRVDGASGSDARQLTFFIVGRDGNDVERVFYRTFTLFHDRLMSLD